MNRELLKYCLAQIERKLGWASSDLWLNQDFELLSDRIFEEVNVKLSITTLKRVWGKVNYASEPSISTLNALAQFIGYQNWSHLKNDKQKAPLKLNRAKPLRVKNKFILGGLFFFITLLIAIGVSGSDLLKRDIDGSHVKFDVQPVTQNLPNSVVFTYDFGNNDVDRAYIQQSWNKKLTFEIDPSGSEATGIYYYPGYFRAKLLVNDKIIKERDVYLRTDGWMATYGIGEIPSYYYQDALLKNGALRLKPEIIEEVYKNEERSVQQLSFHLFEDFGEVYGTNFEFETRFRNTFNSRDGICQHTQVLVHGTEGVLLMPFSIPGCVSDLSIVTPGQMIDGKSNDLSAFGTNIMDWQELKCISDGNEVKIILNDQLIKELTLPVGIGKIVGFKYRFMGAGEIDYVKLIRNGEVVFQDSFEVNNKGLTQEISPSQPN